MSSLRTVTLALSLLMPPIMCVAENDYDQEWVRLIKADFPQRCVIRLDQYMKSVGANGARSSAWLVQTCEGNFEYGAGYLPPGVRPEEERIVVRRHSKLRPFSPAQLTKMYDLKG